MDIIYSRKRIRFPRKFKRNKKKLIIAYVAIIFLFCLIFILQAIYPIFKRVCEDKAQSIATKISNDESTKVMANYNYNKLVNVEKDQEGNVTMVETNIITINEITSSIANNILDSIENNKNQIVYIRSGSVTGSKILAGLGPNIPIRIDSAGTVTTNLLSEFVSTGINQTLHRIYLEITCSVAILTPFKPIGKDVVSQVLLAESVIIGDVPSSYYNLEGMTTDDSMNFLEN